MRFTLLVFLCALSLSASAQWYRVDLKIKHWHERFPPIVQVTDHSMTRLPVVALSTKVKVRKQQLDFSEITYDAAIYFAIKKAQHNMRFRVYDEASYNFSDLAQLYIHRNKFTEAKWYLLQSNNISRQENDYRHTITNLLDLAMIKASLGDYALAQQDLAEAHDIATQKGFIADLPGIEQKMLCIKQNKPWPQKPEQAEIPVTAIVTKIE